MSKRACDHNDLDIKHSKCVDGKRTVSYKWSDVNKDGKPDCNPKHNASTVQELPKDESVECKQCSKGMKRDSHGNCSPCPLG